MSELTKYEAYKKKLEGICDENELVYRFTKDKYPISLIIKPSQDVSAQLTLISRSDDEGVISSRATLVFAYRDGELDIRTTESFAISDTLLNKLKNLYKNMHACWVQHFHRSIIEQGLLSSHIVTNLAATDDASDENAPDDELDDAEMVPIEFPDETDDGEAEE